ncbi:85/88 kDa calcium-independent phospholipase A2-like [Patiria miniata]|uniref:phospholipase A2 n=1 Tax=Patiria miniata TaxID=46514 RepID=A0A914AWU2_PATMI|nr:85/88 kDa calcium-independent phospholipase A2-like [Patiria miniata]XP_038067726.1 85/88 kDa calcium-independent phospholipase A2-like [Patiria miniata]
MSLFREFNQMVTNVLSNIPTVDSYARTVRKVDNPALKHQGWPVMASLDGMQLLHDVRGRKYECLLHLDASHLKSYSMFRLNEGDQTMAEFSKLYQTLYPFCKAAPEVLDAEILQAIVNSARTNPTWSSAHHAVAAKFEKCIAAPEIREHINSQACDAMRTPVHLAVKWNNASMVKTLIISGAKLGIVDAEGENVFHYVARLLGDTAPMLQFLAEDTSGINACNHRRLTALQIACQQGNLNTAAGLVTLGASVNVTDSMGCPIHYAFKYQHYKAAESILGALDIQLDSMLCVKYGGSALHYAKSPAFIKLVTKRRGTFDVNLLSKTGHSPLHIMVQRQRLECVLALLCAGADVGVALPGGDMPLHQAVRKNDLDMVYAMIVFGADINALNSKGESPRHVASTQLLSSLGGLVGSSNNVISALHLVGAQRCPVGMKGCSAGCKADGTYDGNPPTSIEVAQSEGNKAYEDFLNVCIGMMATRQKVTTATDETDSTASPRHSDNILSLDGGGIRGLILTQILLAIEEAAGRPIADMFDWIAGTSTGGILALALAVGYSVKEARSLYFTLKDEVFIGSRPYASEPLENYLRHLFGEDTKMDSITKHKVLVTATLGDRTPPPLHIFRTYEPPASSSSACVVYNKDNFISPPLYHDQLIWKAARSSGAAPSYFQPMGCFLDGGLIANNPTLDALTELQEYYMDRQMKGEPTRNVGVVVSVGTGNIPIKPMRNMSIVRPSGIMGMVSAAKAAAGLGEIFVDLVTDARGRTLDRARSWCNMIGAPFYRFSPPLSADIPLDETKDRTILKMLWETQVYLHRRREKIQHLGELLKSMH